MNKKKAAMEHLNGVADEIVEVAPDDPLAVSEEALLEAVEPPAENRKPKRGRKPGTVISTKRKKNTGIIRVVSKKSKKKQQKALVDAPEPDEDGEYEVEAIVDHKKEKGKTVYRVRWKGYPAGQDSWLPGAELSCKDLLKRYKKKTERETKDVYTVSKIIDHRRAKGKIYYRIRWENYSAKDDTWQVKESLSCNELLKEYHANINDEILKREESKLEAKVKAKQSNNEYEVESIVDKKSVKGKVKYLIRWKGWDSSDDTWEPEETLNCPELIRAFNKKAKSSKKSSAKKRKRYDSDDSGDDDSDFEAGKKKKGSVGGGQYEVEKILDCRLDKKGKWEFFVMWKGWSPDNNTWEPEANLNCPVLINQFLGKDKIPKAVKVQLEKVEETISSPPKKERQAPKERSSAGGLRGRTKGARKVLV